MTGTVTSLLASGLAATGAVASARAWSRARAAELAEIGIDDPRRSSAWRAAVRPLARRLAPGGADREKVISRLQTAGRSAEPELGHYLEERVLALILGVGLGLVCFAAVGGHMAALLPLAGVVPGMRLDMIAQDRREAISRGLPAATDLLMTCVDAGLSVEQSVYRVAREFSRSSPVLAEEFGLCASECEAGVALAEALRRMARRVELDELSGLCSVIAQAHELGAPIVAALADYADSARKLRMAQLEEWAGKLAMKLIFPTALFLLPAALVIMLGPALATVMTTLRGM
jgi:tight adherence protein C